MYTRRLTKNVIIEGNPHTFGHHTSWLWNKTFKPEAIIECRADNRYVLMRVIKTLMETPAWKQYEVEIFSKTRKILTRKYFQTDRIPYQTWALKEDTDWILAEINGGYTRTPIRKPRKKTTRSTTKTP